jgi:hypothetical protein
MTDKIEYSPGNYECLNYNSKPQCKSCDGFGRNLDSRIETEKCYTAKEQIDCSKHPVNVRKYDSIEELAEEIGKLKLRKKSVCFNQRMNCVNYLFLN